MTDPRVQRIVGEWRRSRRLRIGALAIVLVLGAHAALSLSDMRAARETQYARDAELLGRLEEASRESAWPARASAAESRLAATRHLIPPARSDGLAQAELQAWLTDLAAYAGLAEANVRVETSLAVPGQPGLWQVLARLDASAPPAALPVFVRALGSAMPWVRTERLDIAGITDYRISVVVRGYFRAADATDGKSPPPRPGHIPSSAEHAAAEAATPAAAGPGESPLLPSQPAQPAQSSAQAPAAGTGKPVSPSRLYPGTTREERRALRRRQKEAGQ